MLQGGFNTGNTEHGLLRGPRRDSASGRCPTSQQSPTNPWCDTVTGWVTRFTGLGTYTIPKIEVQIAGTLRSDQGGEPGRELERAQLGAPSGLNRPFAGVAGNIDHGQPDRAGHALR